VDLALHRKLKYVTFNVTKGMLLYISIIINILGKVKEIEIFFNTFIHVYNFITRQEIRYCTWYPKIM